MQNITVISLVGIAGALVVGSLLGIAGSQGSVQVFGVPLFLVCGLFAFVVQWLAFIPAWFFQTEHYFDLTGSLTYLSLMVLVLAFNPHLDLRGLLIIALVSVWALRLGSFLFLRIRRAGFDRRFTRMKTIFWQFLMTWTLQGLWVFVTLSAGLAAMTSVESRPPGSFALLGGCLWLAGFLIEVTADRQKRRFRENPANHNRFIREGFWAWSRHPNYFGEIVLWIGIAVIALPVLSGWRLATLISPLFVFVLLNYISGVRMLESRADRQWGNDAEYLSYKRRTPTLIPLPPGHT